MGGRNQTAMAIIIRTDLAKRLLLCPGLLTRTWDTGLGLGLELGLLHATVNQSKQRVANLNKQFFFGQVEWVECKDFVSLGHCAVPAVASPLPRVRYLQHINHTPRCRVATARCNHNN